MNLTPLHDVWLAQLAEQEHLTLLITGAAILVILTIALAEVRYRPWLLIVAALLLGLITLALFLFNLPGGNKFPMISHPLWYDEAFTWRVARLPFHQMMDALAGDVHPPLWYVIEWVTSRLIGDSEIALRLPALVFGVLGAWLTGGLAEMLGYGRRVAVWSVLGLFALPGWLYYAQEARMYTLLACAVLVAVIGVVTRRHWLMALGMIAALYTQTLSVFYVVVVAGLALWWSLRGDTGRDDHTQAWRFPVTTLVWLGVVGVAWLPWLAVLAGQIGDVSNGFWIPDRSLGGYLLELWRVMVMIGQPACLQIPALLVGVGLLSLAVWMAWRDRVRGAMLLALALGPVALMAIASEVWRPVYLHRALLPSLPFLVLLVEAAVERVLERCSKTINVVMVVFLLLSFCWQGKEGLAGTDLAGDVAQVYRDGDVIYHVNLASYILLSYYLPEPEYAHVVWPDAGNLSQALTVQTQTAMGIARSAAQDVDADRLLVMWIENPMSSIAEVEELHQVLKLGKGRQVATWVSGDLVRVGLWAVRKLPKESKGK